MKGYLRASFLAASIIASPVYAEKFPAAQRQYVVEWNESSVGLSDRGITASALKRNSNFSPISVIEESETGEIRSASSNPKIELVDSDPEFCRRLINEGTAKSCSPNYKLTTSVVPNDPGFSTQYWHKAIESEKAWDVATGNSSVVVGVIDTGVDYNHPDLNQNMFRNSLEVPGNNIDDDLNGVVDDVFGYNAITGSGDPMDRNVHGTHCAGIIGAKGNNGVGVAGVAWNTQIMAIKFLRDEGWGFTSDAIKGIDYAVMMKKRGVNIRVLNNSWGGGGFSEPLEAAIKRAAAEGIIFVAAAGNSASDNDALSQYPAGYNVSNVVSVAATGEDNKLTNFSCFGAETVDIAAPGSFIKSTGLNNGYLDLSGTSMATPFVAGALGLLFSREPNLTSEQAIQRLYSSAKPESELEGMIMTGRILNVNNLVRGIVVPEPVVDQVCGYQVSEISFSPDSRVESAPILSPINNTFLDNVKVDLPFNFPFYGKGYNSMTVSPNGVVYFEGAPEPWGYSNGPVAPRFSIAALSTYLYDYNLQNAPLGVRVRKDSTRVDVRYFMRHPWNRDAGTIGITLSIFPSGDIETHVSVSSERLTKTLLYGSLIGIRGENLANSKTVTYNGYPFSIIGNRAFRFSRPSECSAVPVPTPEVPVPTPEMTPPPVEIAPEPSITPAPVAVLNAVNFGGGNRDGEIKRGKRFTLEFLGEGSGTFDLSLSVNNQVCDQRIRVELNKGVSIKSRKLPRLSRSIKRIGLGNGLAKLTGKGANKSIGHKARCERVSRILSRMN